MLKMIKRYGKFIGLAAFSAALTPQVLHAGAYVFAGQNNGLDAITHPKGYTGAGGIVTNKVCIVPGTPNTSAMVQPIKNNIAIWNKRQSTTSNLRGLLNGGEVDFESVSLHELGHCIGFAHPNLASESRLSGDDQNYTKALVGADGDFNIDAGVDGVIGSADDVRGDDQNLHYFNPLNNNPFSESTVVDSTTYTRDVTSLPAMSLFPANADRSVSGLYSAPNSEAAMQQGSFDIELQRTLGHDDVATLRYGMSGLDELAGTADDYTLELVYGGILADPSCDINIAFEQDSTLENNQTGFAVCQLSGFFYNNSSHTGINAANIFFDDGFNWVFNASPPCEKSFTLTAKKWFLLSLPCQVGISSSGTVADVFGDDLGTLGTDWAIAEYVYTPTGMGANQSASYKMLTATDELSSEKAYWIISFTTEVVDVAGEYNSRMDSKLGVQGTSGIGWNIVGYPFRFAGSWGDTDIIDDNGDVLDLLTSDSTGNCSNPGCVVQSTAFKWSDGNYVSLTTSAPGVLDPFDGVWVVAGKPDVSLRFAMPDSELTMQ